MAPPLNPVLFPEQAPSNSTAWQAYNAGVKMGCWGLVIYAATGAICSGEWSPGKCSGTGNVAEGTLPPSQEVHHLCLNRASCPSGRGMEARVSSSQGQPLQPVRALAPAGRPQRGSDRGRAQWCCGASGRRMG